MEEPRRRRRTYASAGVVEENCQKVPDKPIQNIQGSNAEIPKLYQGKASGQSSTTQSPEKRRRTYSSVEQVQASRQMTPEEPIHNFQENNVRIPKLNQENAYKLRSTAQSPKNKRKLGETLATIGIAICVIVCIVGVFVFKDNTYLIVCGIPIFLLGRYIAKANPNQEPKPARELSAITTLLIPISLIISGIVTWISFGLQGKDLFDKIVGVIICSGIPTLIAYVCVGIVDIKRSIIFEIAVYVISFIIVAVIIRIFADTLIKWIGAALGFLLIYYIFLKPSVQQAEMDMEISSGVGGDDERIQELYKKGIRPTGFYDITTRAKAELELLLHGVNPYK